MKKKILIIAMMMATLFATACGASGGNGDYAEEAPYYDDDYYYSGESYNTIEEGGIRYTDNDSTLTFSLKVDTAAYTNIQRYIDSGSTPPKDAVRIEEMINFFNYDEKVSIDHGPFGIYTEIGPSPFDPEKSIAFIRVKTQDIDKSDLPDSNLVFLIDTSGSMGSDDKLPLLKQSLNMLTDQLDANDTISIVTYAGTSRVNLEGESGANKQKIKNSINSLRAGGSTAGGQGIQTAYSIAQEYYIEGGNNRVILASDGDFNVGISDLDELSEFISEKRKTGIYLSVLGFGTGNIRDDIMETLAKDGNGNYSYINSLKTAEKVLVDEMTSNMFTVADDVKSQVEFNPENVYSYRLIGYENRMLDNSDFKDDQKDAGEIGAGSDIVMMFEFEMTGNNNGTKYGNQTGSQYADELFEVRIRYKDPGQSESRQVTVPVTFDSKKTKNTSDFNFACSVAIFGHVLRNSEHLKQANIYEAIELAESNLGKDEKHYRAEFIDMMYSYQGDYKYS